MKYENDGLSSLVDCARQIPEPLLASSVPNLHFEAKPVQHKCFDFEVDADGCYVRHLVLGVDVPEQDISLADRGVTDDSNLGKGIEWLFIGVGLEGRHPIVQIL